MALKYNKNIEECAFSLLEEEKINLEYIKRITFSTKMPGIKFGKGEIILFWGYKKCLKIHLKVLYEVFNYKRNEELFLAEVLTIDNKLLDKNVLKNDNSIIEMNIHPEKTNIFPKFPIYQYIVKLENKEQLKFIILYDELFENLLIFNLESKELNNFTKILRKKFIYNWKFKSEFFNNINYMIFFCNEGCHMYVEGKNISKIFFEI